MSPKVSIIIPVFNGSNYLASAIESALAQTYENLEIIVVNDGSRDGGLTEAVALKFGNRIKYYQKENGGVASALNFGIEKMTGEYFSWLSHDDIHYPHKTKSQIEYLKSRGWKKCVLFSDYDFMDDNGILTREFRYKNVPGQSFLLNLILSHSVNGCTILIPKEIITENFKFAEHLKYTQDYDLWFRLARLYRFEHVPESLVGYREHEVQGSRAQSAVHRHEIVSYYKNAISECIKLKLITYKNLREIKESFRKRGLQEISRFIYSSFVIEKLKNGFVKSSETLPREGV